jgi:non-specific serine/threonine protein kinase
VEAAPSAATPPAQLTRFVGRRRELDEITRLLRSVRLLTLTGSGGSGKTRLAAEVAAGVVPGAAADFPGGVAWVELAPLGDPLLLTQHVASAVGVREQPGRPLIETLLGAWRDRPTLLVLDNCEHLVDACAHLAEALLRGCRELTILATSREALGVAGETAWLVPPLSLPAPEAGESAAAVGESEAVQLFVERARAVLPAFSLDGGNASAVGRICHRLDGLPLAIELAAARVRVLPPTQIAHRLDDAFRLLTAGARTALPRHRTLKAAIDWSYALLAERERTLLARLAVFASGFTLEAAEAVCAGDGIDADEVLDLVSALVDKSLVDMQQRRDSARYRLLETVRQYAQERLDADGAAATLRRRHAEFYRDLVEAADTFGFAPTGASGRSVVEPEQDNVRAALLWASGPAGDAEIELRLLGSIFWFWHRFGFTSEYRRWADRALDRPENRAPTPARGKVLQGAATASWMQGDNAASLARTEECCAVWRATPDEPTHLVLALNHLGQVLKDLGRLDAALAAAEESVAVARAADRSDPPGWLRKSLPLALAGLGSVLDVDGDAARATALLREAAAHWPAASSIGVHSIAVGRLSILALRRGDLAEADRYSREALDVLRPDPAVWLYCRGFHLRAAIFSQCGDHRRAVRLLGAAERLRERSGVVVLAFERPLYDGALRAARAALSDDVFVAAWAEGRAMSLEAAVEEALAGSVVAPAVSPPAASPAASPALEPPPQAAPAPELRVLALGPLQILRGGALLGPEAWGSAKSRELLVFLLCHPGGCTKEQVGLAFWPEASTEQVRNNFHVTLHRLRKALGHADWIVLADERYRVTPDVGCDFDARRFEHELSASLRELRGRAQGATGERAVERLEAALALYRGDFLDGEPAGDWHLELRERLQRLYVDGLSALGRRMFDAERYADAASAYRRLLVRDTLHEEGHRQLMRCLARLGDRAGAMRLHQRLVVLLRDELDAEPDDETAALLARLQRGEAI